MVQFLFGHLPFISTKLKGLLEHPVHTFQLYIAHQAANSRHCPAATPATQLAGQYAIQLVVLRPTGGMGVTCPDLKEALGLLIA